VAKLKYTEKKVNGVLRKFADPNKLIPRKLNRDIYTNEEEEKRTQNSVAKSYKDRVEQGLVPNEQPVMVWPDGLIDAGHTRRASGIIAGTDIWIEFTDKPRIDDKKKPYSALLSVTSSNEYRKMTHSVKCNEYDMAEKAYMGEYDMARPVNLRDEHIQKLGTTKGTLDKIREIKNKMPNLLPKIDSGEMAVKSAWEEATGRNQTKVFRSNNLDRDWGLIYTDDIFNRAFQRVYNIIHSTLGQFSNIDGEDYFPFRDFTDGAISTIISHLIEMIGSEVLKSEGHDVKPASGHPTDPDIHHIDIDDKVEVKVTKYDGTQTNWKGGKSIREGQYILATYDQEVNRWAVIFTQLLEKDWKKSGSGIMSGHTLSIKNVFNNHKDTMKVIYGDVYENNGKIILQLEKLK
jgi:hypothetical protein